MTTSTPKPGDAEASAPAMQGRDAAYWARPVERLKLINIPDGALNLNVDGRHVMSPVKGFGKLWQKTYRVRLEGTPVTPQEVIATWKRNFPRFWGGTRAGSRFHAPLSGLAAGDVVLIEGAAPGGAPIPTGIMVMYADDESFTFTTPEGHPFSGWVTFSAYDDGDTTVAQAQVLIRCNDPLWEIAMPLGLGRIEDRTWLQTVSSVATHFGAHARPEMTALVVDNRRQWRQAGNVRYNAMLRSAFYMMGIPARRMLARRRGR